MSDTVNTVQLATMLRFTPHNAFRLFSRAYIGRQRKRRLSNKLYSLDRCAALLTETSGRPVSVDNLRDSVLTSRDLLRMLADAGQFCNDHQLRKIIAAGLIVPIRLGREFRYPLTDAKALIQQLSATEVAV